MSIFELDCANLEQRTFAVSSDLTVPQDCIKHGYIILASLDDF